MVVKESNRIYYYSCHAEGKNEEICQFGHPISRKIPTIVKGETVTTIDDASTNTTRSASKDCAMEELMRQLRVESPHLYRKMTIEASLNNKNDEDKKEKQQTIECSDEQKQRRTTESVRERVRKHKAAKEEAKEKIKDDAKLQKIRDLSLLCDFLASSQSEEEYNEEDRRTMSKTKQRPLLSNVVN